MWESTLHSLFLVKIDQTTVTTDHKVPVEGSGPFYIYIFLKECRRDWCISWKFTLTPWKEQEQTREPFKWDISGKKDCKRKWFPLLEVVLVVPVVLNTELKWPWAIVLRTSVLTYYLCILVLLFSKPLLNIQLYLWFMMFWFLFWNPSLHHSDFPLMNNNLQL